MKTSYCVIAAIFIGTSIMTMVKCPTVFDCTNGPMKKYKNLLSDKQKKIYEEIVAERKSIYYKGMVAGILAAFLYYSAVSMTDTRIEVHTCAIVAITMGVQYFVYQLHPKSKHMISVLESKEQIAAWLKVRNSMKTKFYLGGVIGLIGYVLLAYGGLYNDQPDDVFVSLINEILSQTSPMERVLDSPTSISELFGEGQVSPGSRNMLYQ
jgi:hypothetical protein